MRTTLLILPVIAILTRCVAYGQGTDSTLGYFPLHVGDVWQYAGAPAFGPNPPPMWFELVTAERDTVMRDGQRYIKLVAKATPIPYPAGPTQYLRIDSARRIVYAYDLVRDSAIEVLYLRCDSIHRSEFPDIRLNIDCRDHRRDTVLNILTDTRDYSQLWEGNSYSFGLGLTYAAWDLESNPMEKRLTYARIDGHAFGKLQGVATQMNHGERLNLTMVKDGGSAN